MRGVQFFSYVGFLTGRVSRYLQTGCLNEEIASINGTWQCAKFNARPLWTQQNWTQAGRAPGAMLKVELKGKRKPGRGSSFHARAENDAVQMMCHFRLQSHYCDDRNQTHSHGDLRENDSSQFLREHADHTKRNKSGYPHYMPHGFRGYPEPTKICYIGKIDAHSGKAAAGDPVYPVG